MQIGLLLSSPLEPAGSIRQEQRLGGLRCELNFSGVSRGALSRAGEASPTPRSNTALHRTLVISAACRKRSTMLPGATRL